jgi:hypothetical protein
LQHGIRPNLYPPGQRSVFVGHVLTGETYLHCWTLYIID